MTYTLSALPASFGFSVIQSTEILRANPDPPINQISDQPTFVSTVSDEPA